MGLVFTATAPKAGQVGRIPDKGIIDSVINQEIMIKIPVF
jgi:hypothetical protein